MNAGTLIASSMRLIGALDSGEVPEPDEANDFLVVLNDMLDAWAAERLMCFTIDINEFNLIPGQQTYTLGSGGDFNMPRPAKIERMSIVSFQNAAQPLELPIQMYTDWDWQSVPVKNITTALPNAVYDDGGYPFRRLSFWCVPNAHVATRIYSWEMLNQFPDLTTDLTFPPGYSEALRYNLAKRLISEMPADYNPVMVSTTLDTAVESLARVRSMNIPLIQIFCDPALSGDGGFYNFYTDGSAGGGNR